jgi:hypothetical protein
VTRDVRIECNTTVPFPRQTVLGDATGAVLNASTSKPARKRKAATSTASGKRVRQKALSTVSQNTQSGPTQTHGPAVPGVSPQVNPSIPATSHPAFPSSHTTEAAPAGVPAAQCHYNSIIHKSSDSSVSSASDVWYFMRALNSNEEPTIKPSDETTFKTKPTSTFVGCRLCKYVTSPF